MGDFQMDKGSERYYVGTVLFRLDSQGVKSLSHASQDIKTDYERIAAPS